MGERVLVISLAPFKFATRTRKAASLISRTRDTTHLSLARAGRTGVADRHGKWVDDGVRVVQVPVIAPRTDPTRWNQVRNLVVCYVPGMALLAIEVVMTPASVVIVGNPSLIPLGLLHRLVFRSSVVVDVSERPGMVVAKGSVASIVSRFEIDLLRFSSRFFGTASVVTTADVKTLKDLGFQCVHLIRNAPLNGWRAPYVEPPMLSPAAEPELTAIAMGSVFEGRGYEVLIEAVAIANRSSRVRLLICGPGRDSYKKSLEEIAVRLDVGAEIEFMDPVVPSEVSSTYLRADVGMVLYESTDPGNDGLSNKLFECVASGRPVIASDLPENRRFVMENEVGWVAQTDAHSIASALRTVHNREVLLTIANHCRIVGDESLNWEAEFAPILALVNGRKGSRR